MKPGGKNDRCSKKGRAADRKTCRQKPMQTDKIKANKRDTIRTGKQAGGSFEILFNICWK
jgi:hypothetical protein